MSVYTRLQKVALRLINKYGRPVTLRLNTDASPPDATKPWNPATPTFVDHDIIGVVSPADEQYVDHTTILQTDSQIIIAAEGLPRDPTPKDQVFDGSQLLRIVEVNGIDPGPIPVAFILFARV